MNEQKIKYYDCEIDEQKTNTIIDSLINNKVISLQFFDCSFDIDKFCNIINTISTKNLSLKILEFIKINDFNSSYLVKICDLLQNNNTLKHIGLQYNKIANNELKAISDVLKTNDSLRSLNLSQTLPNLEGVKYITDALKENKMLEILYYKNNYIGSDGANLFGKMIKENDKLNYLDLSGNNIGYDSDNSLLRMIFNTITKNFYQGYISITEALKVNTTLKYLQIENNRVDKKIGNLFANALHINTSLLELNIELNKINDDRIQTKITEELQTNRNIFNEYNGEYKLLKDIISPIINKQNNISFSKVRTNNVLENGPSVLPTVILRYISEFSDSPPYYPYLFYYYKFDDDKEHLKKKVKRQALYIKKEQNKSFLKSNMKTRIGNILDNSQSTSQQIERIIKQIQMIKTHTQGIAQVQK